MAAQTNLPPISRVDQLWNRYYYLRDTGHLQYVERSALCDDFFLGFQWSQGDLDKLSASKRPALTINKTLGRLASVFGEQIRTRAEIGFKPSKNSSQESADTLSKIYKNISEANRLRWSRTAVFCDGAVGSRGFYEVELSFADNLLGDVKISRMDGKSVLVDADANAYDPDTWNDVMVTRWYSPEEIAYTWGEELAMRLRSISPGEFPYEGDAIVRYRDRFRTTSPIIVPSTVGWGDTDAFVRFIRVIEWQRREETTLDYFVNTRTGDMRQVPYSWDRERIAEYVRRSGLGIMRRKGRRIKTQITAANEELFNDWSPYRHFTPVPYFPFFRNGRATGLVEQLIGPQELLNKSLSQELHIINTSANSGWKVRSGRLKNMTIEELEDRGAESGLVLELEELDDAEKIASNNIPTGIDRMVQHASVFFGDVSMVPDASIGQAQADVPAKAQRQQAVRGAFNMTMPLDNLEQTDALVARNVLDIVQEYYTDERVFRVTIDSLTGATEEIQANAPQDGGGLLNDLTEGEYDVVVSTQPDQLTFEESQFEHAKELKGMGLPIPDEVLIENSQLARKREILQQMKNLPPPPEVQKGIEKLTAEIEKIYAEINRINADALGKRTGAANRIATTRKVSAEADEVASRTNLAEGAAARESQPPERGQIVDEEPDFDKLGAAYAELQT